MARARTKSFEALLSDVRQIIENGLQKAYQGVDFVMVHTYWLVGQRIVVEEQNGEARAEYGSKLLENLAGSDCYYWSSWFNAEQSLWTCGFGFDSDTKINNYYFRHNHGHSVRPVCE